MGVPLVPAAPSEGRARACGHPQRRPGQRSVRRTGKGATHFQRTAGQPARLQCKESSRKGFMESHADLSPEIIFFTALPLSLPSLEHSVDLLHHVQAANWLTSSGNEAN